MLLTLRGLASIRAFLKRSMLLNAQALAFLGAAGTQPLISQILFTIVVASVARAIV
jgi:hypothetical protein